MTTYVAIANSEIDQDSPGTQPLFTALRDNPISIAEGGTNALYAQAGWFPYDGANVGDGNDGLIYDQAVDGTVATITSPDFTNGYEYMFFFEGLSHNSGSSQSFQMEMYKETSAAWAGPFSLAGTLAAADTATGIIEARQPRGVVRRHFAHYLFSIITATGTLTPNGIVFYHATAQKVLRARFSWTAGSNDAGKIYMYKRRDFS